MSDPTTLPAGFEGAWDGERDRLPAEAKLECRICWWVYDPAEGDETWQIAPGTPFAELPDYWRCPQCDAQPGQFLMLEQGSG